VTINIYAALERTGNVALVAHGERDSGIVRTRHCSIGNPAKFALVSDVDELDRVLITCGP